MNQLSRLSANQSTAARQLAAQALHQPLKKSQMIRHKVIAKNLEISLKFHKPSRLKHLELQSLVLYDTLYLSRLNHTDYYSNDCFAIDEPLACYCTSFANPTLHTLPTTFEPIRAPLEELKLNLIMRNTNSERILLLRPLLIFLIVSTHIQGNLYRADLKNIDFTLNNFIHAFLSGSLAISALPLLSIISGYLGAYSYKKYRYLTTVKKKIPRILVPMLFWNLVMALIIYNLQSQGISFRKDLALYPFNVEQWLYSLTAVFRIPANPPLYFLRELFICFLLIPILFQTSKSKIATAIGASAVAYMSIQGINLGFFHRIDILGFFLLGLFLNNQPGLFAQLDRVNTSAWHLSYLLTFTVALLLLTAYALNPEHPDFIYYLKAMTVLGPLALWVLSGYISGSIKRFLLWVSPASFPVFLGHIVLLDFYWRQWGNFFGVTPLDEHYLWYWISAFILCFSSMGVLSFLYRKIIKHISSVRAQKNNVPA